MKSYKYGKIIENIEIYKDIWKMKVDVNLAGKAGQFFMFRSKFFGDQPLLSRPFGVCDQDEEGLTLLYQKVGKGTDLMTSLKKGEEVEILGPLGNGFEILDREKIAVVAGGIGIAPLLYLCKKLNKKIDFYAGFSVDPYFVKEFEPYVNKIVTTSDKKDKIFITEKINPDDYDLIYACGPNPMLEALCAKNTSAQIQVSMESHMACGIGACLGCTIKNSQGEFVRVCKDGPVFDSKEVF